MSDRDRYEFEVTVPVTKEKINTWLGYGHYRDYYDVPNFLSYILFAYKDFQLRGK